MTEQTPSLARLKSLEMQGYKTFASKNLFLFAPTITAIVGPNGSGKSNITDAIRWVLGEQSFSLLRGKRTEDMIFSGSDARSRASMASATITFDNSDGWLPIEFTEVTIGRRAYRDGQNEYLLNGQRVRLRDVTELLSKCGLGQRTYTIIGQGLVDAALSLRADERRQLFEEAAGIGLYRSRREEALRRLENTQRNLERVQDILTELKPRLRSLKRQVERSQGYDQVRSDLQELLRTWYGYHWYRLLDTLREKGEQAEAYSAERDALWEQQSGAEGEIRALRAKMEKLREQLGDWRQAMAEHTHERERIGRELAIAEERLRWLEDDRQRLQPELDELQDALSDLKARDETAAAEVAEAEADLSELLASRQTLLEAGHVGTDQRERLREELAGIRERLEGMASSAGALRARQEELEKRLAALDQTRAPLLADLSQIESGLKDASSAHSTARERLEEIEREISSQHQVEEEARRRAWKTEEGLAAQRAALEEAGRKRAALEGQLAGLDADQGEGSKLQLLWKAHASGRLEGVLGRLAEQIEIEPGYDAAVLAALGSAWRGVAFRSLDELLRAAEREDLRQAGGALVMLADTMGGAVEPLAIPAGIQSLGLARQFVRGAESLRPLLDALLNRIIVVEDRGIAAAALRKLPPGSGLVTLEGDVFAPGGRVTLGAGQVARDAQAIRSKLETQLAGRVEAVERLETELKQMEQDRVDAEEAAESARARARELEVEAASLRRGLEDSVRELENLQGRLAAARKRIEDLDEEARTVRSAQESLQEEGEDMETERGQLEAAYRATMHALEMAESSSEMQLLESRLERAQNQLEGVQTQLRALRDRERFLQREIELRRERFESQQAEKGQLAASVETGGKLLAAVEERIQALTAEIEPAERALREAQARRLELETGDSELRMALQQAEREHARLQIELARKQEEMTSLRRRIEDDFGLVAFEEEDPSAPQEPLPLEGIVEHLPRVEELPVDVENQLKQQRLQLRRIGPVNPEARREYREVSERVEFLTAQVDDLRAAERQIREVIAELDVLMEREFRVTFEAVATAFRETFTRLFGGGSARLTLTDPDDLTSSGIDIEARLPGRRTQSLAMLSGGERSLTASALIFALLKVSPTPFCVLDEVDAMLDEANVVRYSEMLRELSGQTQFILITHNRQTVQAAQVVYGVSMGPDSASKVISLKLDEVAEQVG
ncbi:MAG: chromosome segregation protein SMC [Anaerolineales bacterium]